MINKKKSQYEDIKIFIIKFKVIYNFLLNYYKKINNHLKYKSIVKINKLNELINLTKENWFC